MPESINITRRVSLKGGLIGLFSGESQGKAMERVVQQLNADGYRVTFVIRDQWNFFKRVQAFLLMLVTLGLMGLTQNVLVIGERVPLQP